MAGRHPFSKLRDRMSTEAKERIEAKVELASFEMDLAEMRRTLKLSQGELAETFGVKQSSVAKLEKRVDMYMSTLHRIIKAMGGELEMIAHFPDRNIRLKNFRDLAEKCA